MLLRVAVKQRQSSFFFFPSGSKYCDKKRCANERARQSACSYSSEEWRNIFLSAPAVTLTSARACQRSTPPPPGRRRRGRSIERQCFSPAGSSRAAELTSEEVRRVGWLPACLHLPLIEALIELVARPPPPLSSPHLNISKRASMTFDVQGRNANGAEDGSQQVRTPLSYSTSFYLFIFFFNKAK